MVFISNHFTNRQNNTNILDPGPDPDDNDDPIANPDQKLYNFINITNYNLLSNNDQAIIDQCVHKWESVINSTPNGIFLNISINISTLSEGILGGASLSKYYVISSQTFEDYEDPQNPGFINPNIYSNYYLGDCIGSHGNITLNSNYWNNSITTLRDDGKSNAYYILLHEIGHLFGIGALWNLQNTKGLDPDTNTYFYVGSRAVQEYNKSISYTSPSGPTYNLLFVPVEDDGGNGTALSHPEEGHESGISTNTRTFDGILYPGLDEEIMTGWLENDTRPLPVSSITVGFLHDLGYNVNYNGADPYTIPYDNDDPKGEIPR